MNEDFLLIVLLISVFFGCTFMTYKVGRYLERKDLTQYFVQMTEKTYWEAFEDGKQYAKTH